MGPGPTAKDAITQKPQIGFRCENKNPIPEMNWQPLNWRWVTNCFLISSKPVINKIHLKIAIGLKPVVMSITNFFMIVISWLRTAKIVICNINLLIQSDDNNNIYRGSLTRQGGFQWGPHAQKNFTGNWYHTAYSSLATNSFLMEFGKMWGSLQYLLLWYRGNIPKMKEIMMICKKTYRYGQTSGYPHLGKWWEFQHCCTLPL